MQSPPIPQTMECFLYQVCLINTYYQTMTPTIANIIIINNDDEDGTSAHACLNDHYNADDHSPTLPSIARTDCIDSNDSRYPATTFTPVHASMRQSMMVPRTADIHKVEADDQYWSHSASAILDKHTNVIPPHLPTTVGQILQ